MPELFQSERYLKGLTMPELYLKRVSQQSYVHLRGGFRLCEALGKRGLARPLL
jgi:hypothetical protein